MENCISTTFSCPEAGWLPVVFRYCDFELEFYASDVHNNPLKELYETLIGLNNNCDGNVTWFLEPFTYFFHFEKVGKEYTLTISQAYDIEVDESEREVIKVITGDYNQVIAPFKASLIAVCSQTFDEEDWPHVVDVHELKQLIMDI